MAADTGRPHTSYWIISSLALVWNLVGIGAFVAQVGMTPEMLQSMPPEERALYENVPFWATAAYGIAVVAGSLGSILLIARSSWAVPMFLLSLGGVLVQMYHAFVTTDVIEVLGGGSVALPALIIAIGVGLIWYSRYAKEKGWFR